MKNKEQANKYNFDRIVEDGIYKFENIIYVDDVPIIEIPYYHRCLKRIESLFRGGNKPDTIDFIDTPIMDIVTLLLGLSPKLDFKIVSLLTNKPISRKDFIDLFNRLIPVINASARYERNAAEEFISGLSGAFAKDIYLSDNESVANMAHNSYYSFEDCQETLEEILMSYVPQAKKNSNNSKKEKK